LAKTHKNGYYIQKKAKIINIPVHWINRLDKENKKGGAMERITLFILVIALGCQASGTPDFSLVGFAAGVTGGTGGRTVQVNNASSFKSNCQNSEKLIIQVTGRIDNASTSIGSNKTIIGVGTSGEITGTTLSIGSGSNIIIRNIKIHHSGRGNDVISISGGKNIWIDHCNIYNAIGDLNGDGKIDTEGDIEGGDVDWYDGLIDMTKSSANITISWNKIHDSFKAMLVGSSDSDDPDRKVTFHHNHFYKLWERVPSYRFGVGHVFNNYYYDIDHSAVNSRMGAKLRVEGNVFENVGSGAVDSKTKIEWGPIGAYYSGTVGCWDVKDNVFTNCKGNQPVTSSCSYTPSYNYSSLLQPSAEVKATVLAWAGVGKLDGSDVAVPAKGIRSVRAVPRDAAVYNCRGVRLPAGALAAARAFGIVIVRDGAGVRISPQTIK
jgi:pectate lyase